MADDYILAARNKIASAKRHLAALNKLRAGDEFRALPDPGADRAALRGRGCAFRDPAGNLIRILELR
jgi:hypothetical protein